MEFTDSMKSVEYVFPNCLASHEYYSLNLEFC